MVSELFPNGLSDHLPMLSRSHSYHISFNQSSASPRSIHEVGVITAGPSPEARFTTYTCRLKFPCTRLAHRLQMLCVASSFVNSIYLSLNEYAR